MESYSIQLIAQVIALVPTHTVFQISRELNISRAQVEDIVGHQTDMPFEEYQRSLRQTAEEAIWAALLEGQSVPKVAEVFGVTENTVNTIWRRGGGPKASTNRSHEPTTRRAYAPPPEEIAQLMQLLPTRTMAEIAKEMGVSVNRVNRLIRYTRQDVRTLRDKLRLALIQEAFEQGATIGETARQLGFKLEEVFLAAAELSRQASDPDLKKLPAIKEAREFVKACDTNGLLRAAKEFGISSGIVRAALTTSSPPAEVLRPLVGWGSGT